MRIQATASFLLFNTFQIVREHHQSNGVGFPNYPSATDELKNLPCIALTTCQLFHVDAHSLPSHGRGQAFWNALSVYDHETALSADKVIELTFSAALSLTSLY